MLKIVIGTNEGKVLCISNNEDKIKASMVNYLIDTDQEPTEDFFESQNWGEYDIEVYEYHQPQLTDDQREVLEWLKKSCTSYYYTSPMLAINKLYSSQQMAPPTVRLSKEEQYQVLAAFAEWGISMENAKEKMEAYLENLSKMGTKEVESLKEEYQNFSNDYQEEGRKE